MAVIGSFGDIVFQVSRQKALSFEGLQHEAGARINSAEVIGREPVIEFLGPESESISMVIRLASELGVKPREEYERLYQHMRSGKASTFVLGGRPMGGSRIKWMIEKLSADHTQFAGNGVPRWIDVSVNLRRYAPRGK
jgi:phage protein U